MLFWGSAIGFVPGSFHPVHRFDESYRKLAVRDAEVVLQSVVKFLLACRSDGASFRSQAAQYDSVSNVSIRPLHFAHWFTA